MSRYDEKLSMRSQVASSELTGLRSVVRRLAVPLLFAGFMAAPTALSANDGAGVTGSWLVEDSAAIVKIAPCGSSAKRVCGNIVWADNEAELKVGDTYLKSFVPVGRSAESDHWVKGRVLKNGSRRGYDGKLNLDGENLIVTYCKGSSCFDATWTRASEQALAAAGLQAGS